MDNNIMRDAFMLLHSLGITPTYDGYYYTAYAVSLIEKQPDRLLLVTKWLYPDIARQYSTTWQCVERNIRTVIALAWKRNPTLLMRLAGYPLCEKPSAGQFLSYMTYALSKERSA